MSPEIKITHELRPCYIGRNNSKTKALFHQWTADGHAIVELEDGGCTTYDPWAIQFIDKKIEKYNFEN